MPHTEPHKTVRTYRYRARVSRQVHHDLDEVCESLRHLWNAALEERIDAYRKFGKTISLYDQQRSLTVIRNDDPGKWGSVAAWAQRSTLKRLDDAFKAFFRRVKAGEKPGFPKFKGKHRPVRSFEVPAPRIHFGPNWHSVNVKGVGRFRFQGDLSGKPKTLRVVSTARRVEVQFTCEVDLSEPVDTRPPLGIDVGIKERVALSSGALFAGASPDKTRLKRLQKSLSRKVKGSKSRGRAQQLVAKEHDRIACRERNALHQLTAKLVKEHSARFYVESLNISNMTKNHSLAESILDQRWGEFFRQLEYKCEAAGGWVRPVRAAGTSQSCSACGTVASEKVTLDVRTFECEHCGYVQDRDVNAARNVLSVGLAADRPAVDKPGHRGKEDGGRLVSNPRGGGTGAASRC